ncbi:nucleotidyltransferase domain-containing protein [Paenibacillus vini]|uniref:Polymerase nucleotidyl transferase domain-containing protein n=1 Tax=Paenibacillus vini TaxID=1476024 RepID=A0ABQ4MAF2_9BACL|nr:nucleotidyltransferase domain-containing protein [Paenibacillus vini]GIP52969.1 hypothetical protein J42TS3_20040 [Paenibacillus vini]
MENILQNMNQRFISIMREQEGVLGAWNFGSALHGTTDKFSDIDIVFLIDQQHFDRIDDSVTEWLESVSDRVIVCWPEGFNSKAIKNYGYIVELEGRLFQYDLFLINQGHADDFICKIHYTDLKTTNIIFEIGDAVKQIIQHAPKGECWNADIEHLIHTYWFHIHMSAKYLLREDFFKLNGVLRTLMDTHTSLLLAAYDKIPWGGSANKLHFLDEEKKNHLKKYGCVDDFSLVRVNMLQSIGWFEADVEDIGKPNEINLNKGLAQTVKRNWVLQTEKV